MRLYAEAFGTTTSVEVDAAGITIQTTEHSAMATSLMELHHALPFFLALVTAIQATMDEREEL